MVWFVIDGRKVGGTRSRDEKVIKRILLRLARAHPGQTVEVVRD